ncbi:amylo-alpha-1,6-glucosidase [Diaminobutyricibacter tongyongensis]|uniref:Amylo-alpha-1,6-glucosidase n=2 Tax=Leifsonia tongyongensis TaxID=1268043 RepID=A0A6L9XTY3_9MICO|nr:glycogen debranching N-terminal domain-containing protein [Diaminobutyricibacter tongyongensis]NEN04860.1 amylo-alpha-1,6-glucosidase [Diaminobutyricibacter tongyongensis]
MTQPHQPLLHDSVVLLATPSQAWSAQNGDICAEGIQGFYHSDLRVLDELRLTVAGAAPEHIATSPVDAATTVFTALARGVDDETADPRVRVERRRTVGTDSLEESITLVNALAHPVQTTVAVVLRADFTPMQVIKSGRRGSEFAVETEQVGSVVRFGSGEVGARLETSDARVTITYGTSGGASGNVPDTSSGTPVAGGVVSVRLEWPVEVAERSSTTVSWRLTVTDPTTVVAGAESSAEWDSVVVQAGDSRLSSWVRSAIGDLQALRMVTRRRPDEVFLAAGAPWFFTLFGRDSIWAARMLLPLGTELAASTLRVLAELQGTHDVAETAEQPGKIMHELRPGTLAIPGLNISLPPLYYGTVDATALWICLLHDAWKWGMPDSEVEALLPNLEAALAWMRDYGDSDGDGFLEYVDTTGHGLANQGWKDSGDSIQWRDGTLAEGPIALCEVQAYAYEAALGGAALLDHFGRTGKPWREWAAALKNRFADSFLIDSPDGAYPAVALDAQKRPVDTVTSNIGHLLGTGILDADGAALVARRLASPELNSGFGLRTMSSDSVGFWPLSYHGGSVWTHDTAIAIAGLGREGFHTEAASLIEGLLRAADGFGYRMPELHSGDSTAVTATPVPYPAACRPQAWSAAASIAVLGTLLGLEADAQAGELRVSPLAASGAIDARGLRFAGQAFSVKVDGEGRVTRS